MRIWWCDEHNAEATLQTATNSEECWVSDFVLQSATPKPCHLVRADVVIPSTAIDLPFGREPKKVADWLVTTCLAYGSTVYTAYKVAGAFVEGLGWEPEPKFRPHTPKQLGRE